MEQNSQFTTSKQEKINAFDPSGVSDTGGGIFGLPFNIEEAEVILIPAPWEVTVSYNAGAANGPEAIRQASYQLDLFDPSIENAWQLGIAMEEIPELWLQKGQELRQKTESYRSWLERGENE